MKCILFFLYCFNVLGGQIPEIEIQDSGILKALGAYADSLQRVEVDSNTKYHLIARCEGTGKSKIVYVAAVVSTDPFWGNVPDSFSRLKNKFVFWYQSTEESSLESYRSFFNQFGKQLIPDRDINGDIDPEKDLEVGLKQFVGVFRIAVAKDSIVGIRKVCDFPNHTFYSRGMRFDPNGNLMFQGGAYDLCSLDKPFGIAPVSFDPIKHIEENLDVQTLRRLRANHVVAYVIVNEKGEVIEVEYKNLPNTLDRAIRKNLDSTIMRMPRLSIGTIEGLPVRYRVGLVL